ncbi:hypothetical protein [Streptomyces sp. NPDC051994]|uniref:hypothetical protein n=1 Tax=unclassified Streptomyces TaxID=2593676 RepID=UPI00341D3064
MRDDRGGARTRRSGVAAEQRATAAELVGADRLRPVTRPVLPVLFFRAPPGPALPARSFGAPTGQVLPARSFGAPPRPRTPRAADRVPPFVRTSRDVAPPHRFPATDKE